MKASQVIRGVDVSCINGGKVRTRELENDRRTGKKCCSITAGQEERRSDGNKKGKPVIQPVVAM